MLSGSCKVVIFSKLLLIPTPFMSRWAMLTRTTPVGRDPKTWTLQEVSSRWIRTTQGLMLLLKQLLLLQLLHWPSEELTLPSPSFSSRLLLGMSCCGVLHGCTKLPKTQLI
ncbi:hypothetical protein MRB53_011095 [Persea americana]|uniref:Uncharacterized protein n=1 Tax=Persea americana TaxID=3435 RepID=A0ACC2LUH5_PERAE|nr:hypothetical protein MRB53_011095 [Persea americana]